MPIGGSATLATLQVPAGHSLHIGQYDVDAYFYRLGIPVDIGAYFVFDPIPSWLVHRSAAPRHTSSVAGEWYPYLRVVPMGWN